MCVFVLKRSDWDEPCVILFTEDVLLSGVLLSYEKFLSLISRQFLDEHLFLTLCVGWFTSSGLKPGVWSLFVLKR